MTETELADRLELLAIEGAYAAFFDSRDGERWAELFTDDGSYIGRAFARTGGDPVAEGATALAELCRTFPFEVVHILGIPHFDIGTAAASARINYTSIVTQEGGEFGLTRVTHGYYDVFYRRTAAGWRIHRRISHALTRHENHQGAAISAVPNLEVSA